MTFPEIKKLQNHFAGYLDKHPFLGEPESLYEAQNYILNLGGKRIRPIALLAALQAATGKYHDGLPAAWTFEIFHNFTLVHDDIMDKSPKRRGKPTVHKKYNVPSAILAGDNMLLGAYQHLACYDDTKFRALTNLLTKTGIYICEGQFLDMQFEDTTAVNETNYLKMIELKTAVLLGASLKAGAIIGEASKEDADNLYNLGINLGIGFQIMDDILDAFGTNVKVGKRKGGDIIANKKTLLLINAMVLANPEQREKLDYWLGLQHFDEEEKILAILDIFSELNIKKLAEKRMTAYYKEAQKCFDKLSFSSTSKAALKELIELIQTRSF